MTGWFSVSAELRRRRAFSVAGKPFDECRGHLNATAIAIYHAHAYRATQTYRRQRQPEFIDGTASL